MATSAAKNASTCSGKPTSSVTNPPFSLFREYVGQLVKYEKKVVIIGNQNAITYKDVFKLFLEKQTLARRPAFTVAIASLAYPTITR